MSGSLVPFLSAKSEYVLDSWPVMEWLKGKSLTADRFSQMVERADAGLITLLTLRMSEINLGEIYYISAKYWDVSRAEEIIARMRYLPILFHSVTFGEVLEAARLKAVYRISYADAFAANLAIARSCPVVSGDPDFLALQLAGVLQLEWFGS